MLIRFVNTAILALVTILTLTGVYGMVWTLGNWAYEVHRMAGWALITLIPWKAGIAWRSLKRGLGPRFDRGPLVVISVLLAVAALLVIAWGLVWAWNVGPWVFAFRQSAISLHWIVALALVPFLALHVWRRWPRPKRVDFTTRRAALKMLALGGAGVIGWWLAEALAEARADTDTPRSVTGSRERASFSGNGFPITNNAGEGKIRLDAASWQLAVAGAVDAPFTLTYDELLALPVSEVTATIDCTTGWYSTQVWRGVRLVDLLARAGVQPPVGSLRIGTISGYLADFPLAEANEILLATHVGGETLTHGHGYPVRAVVPSRRGWFWVKWVTGIEALPGPRPARVTSDGKLDVPA
jgi:DMSO/TMAO reductase YedYZ molybdopterin-dependent catalytic subunit